MTAVNKKFFNQFWTDPTCQTIFSVHKSQLLEDEVELIVTREKFFAQRLVLTNSQKRKTSAHAIKRTENESIELIHNLKTAASEYFDADRIEALIKERFGPAIKKIETDLKKTGGWLKLILKLLNAVDDEKGLFRLLSDYHLIPKEIENHEQFSKYAEIQLTDQLKGFIKKRNLSELAISIDLISTYYNHKIKDNLLSATKHYTDILYDADNFHDRLEFFDGLYEMGVIIGGKLKSYYECTNCPPNTLNGVLTTNIKPSKLKLKCPNCNKEALYIVPYELNKSIYDHIVHKDGLLFAAIEHLFQENNYTFKVNFTLLEDIEFDFCLLNDKGQIYEIIEVKMFKTDRPDDTQIGNIRQAVGQMKAAIDKLTPHDSGYKTIKHSIVTNLIKDAVYKAANIELEKDLKEYNIDLYSVSDFYSKIKK
jgi:hypothetical protein